MARGRKYSQGIGMDRDEQEKRARRKARQAEKRNRRYPIVLPNLFSNDHANDN